MSSTQTARVYRPRQAQQTVLHQVVREYLPELIELAELGSYSLPAFVQGELEAFLACGDLSEGFTHLKCSRCGHDRFLPFSCKTRSICSSCSGRRMNETAAVLVDQVIPDIPLRHWALTFPPPLRYLLAFDSEICSKVLNIFVHVVFAWQRRMAKKHLGLDSVRHAHPGAILAIHRVGSALNLNLHLHSAFMDGVFVQAEPRERPVFRALPAPGKGDILGLAWDICKQTMKLLQKLGMSLDVDPADGDTLAQESPLLAACYAASMQGSVALGDRAGQRVMRLGDYVSRTACDSTEKQQTQGHGFNLHAGYRASAKDRKGRERILHYILRPPIATKRLSRGADGRVVYSLRKPWADGTRSFVFEPLDFLAKLLPMVPPPRVNQVRYFGVFAPHSRLRAQVVPECDDAADEDGQLALDFEKISKTPGGGSSDPSDSNRARSQRIAWADLAARTFSIDVLECSHCGHRPLQVVGVLGAPSPEQLAAALAATSDSSPVRWPRRARAPPVGQMELPFACAAA